MQARTCVHIYLLPFLFRQRYLDDERTTRQILFIVAGAFNPDLAFMRFDDPSGNCQAETGSAALEFGTTRRMQFHLAKLIEFLENDLMIGQINANPRIAIPDIESTAITLFSAILGDMHFRALLGEKVVSKRKLEAHVDGAIDLVLPNLARR